MIDLNRPPRVRQCQECHGYGGHKEVIVDGQGPWEPCWACGGTGEMTAKQVGVWLSIKRADKRTAKN